MRDAQGQFDLAWTSSLRETLERIEREHFDAVLLDLSLPDSHGLDTITRLCSAAPAHADPRDHGLDGRADRRRGRPLRRGGLPGQGADGRPLDGPGDPLCHRPQAGGGGVESGEELRRAGEGRRRAGQPRQGPFPGGLEPRAAHAPDAGGDGPVDAPGPAGPRPGDTRDPGNGPPQRGIGGAADRRLAGRVADRAGKDRTEPQRRRVVYDHPAGGRGLQARHRGAEAALRRGLGSRPRRIGSRPTPPGCSRSSGTC